MIEFKLPAIGEGVVEGEIVRWLKQPGDPIEADEPIMEIATDKVDSEIPSPVDGILAEQSVGALFLLGGIINVVMTVAALRLLGDHVEGPGQARAITLYSSCTALGGATSFLVCGLTLPVARDLMNEGVRVNTILPGLIDTPIYGEGEASEQFKERLAAGVLFPKRLGAASEFATLAGELLRNSYMNAESIRIDAGIRMQPK